MSKTFAIIKNAFVENTVLADDGVIVAAFFPDADEVVEVTEKTQPASIGFGYKDGKFIPPSPFKSWFFDEESWQWRAPKERPSLSEGQYSYWNEEKEDWIIEAMVAPIEVLE